MLPSIATLLFNLGEKSSLLADDKLHETSATQPDEYSGLKLIVCATIMGVSARLGYEDNWQEQSKPFPGANSHVDASRFQYIVFNRAQILPCYVIHLGWSRDNTRFFEDIPTNPQT